jgi:hypothetical protein
MAKMKASVAHRQAMRVQSCSVNGMLKIMAEKIGW